MYLSSVKIDLGKLSAQTPVRKPRFVNKHQLVTTIFLTDPNCLMYSSIVKIDLSELSAQAPVKKPRFVNKHRLVSKHEFFKQILTALCIQVLSKWIWASSLRRSQRGSRVLFQDAHCGT